MSEPAVPDSILPMAADILKLPWGSINAILVVSAIAAFAMLVGVGVVTGIVLSRRRDGIMRLFKSLAFIAIFAVTAIPCFLLSAGSAFLVSFALPFYVVFLAFFCYYLGKGVGEQRGRQQFRDLMGMDSSESIEDAQDRLFESRMRLPCRSEVVLSIGNLAKENRQAACDADQPADDGTNGSDGTDNTDGSDASGIPAAADDMDDQPVEVEGDLYKSRSSRKE